MHPVCSVDGITYDNKCKAECNQAEVLCKGKCPCGNYVIYYLNHYLNAMFSINMVK